MNSNTKQSSCKPHYVYLKKGNASQLWHLYKNEGFNLSHSLVTGKHVVVFAEGTIEEYLKKLNQIIIGYGKDSSHIKYQQIEKRGKNPNNTKQSRGMGN